MNTYQCEKCQQSFQRRSDTQKSSFLKWKQILCLSCLSKIRGENNKGKRHLSEEHKNKLMNARKLLYPSLSIDCKYCQKTFLTPYRERNRLYCSRSCQSKAMIRSDIRKKSICLMCHKEFLHYGERVVCGSECNARYMSMTRIGDNNPASKSCHKETKVCLACHKPFTFSRNNLHVGQQKVFCSLACSHSLDIKGLNLGKRQNPYPINWIEIKEVIRQRDKGICILCGADDKNLNHRHPIHHIDYNPKNLDPQNLITLCKKCHNTTNHGRTFWEIIFTALISGSKIVKKGWGVEVHITNNPSYCLKYLIFFKHKQFSYHSHNLKKELWHCLWGKFECILSHEDKKQYFIFKQGDKIELEPHISHQLRALRNCILTEVSTPDFPEDSIRISKGD